MPSLGSHLNYNQLEARNMTVHNLSAAPSSPVKGQMYYDTVANSLLWWNGTVWIAATAPNDATTTAKGVVQLAGDLTGSAAAPTVANGAITAAKMAAGAASGNVGSLGGDLTGSLPSPTIATGAVTSAKIADGTITDVDVASANKDGAVGTYSMRTIGTGATQAMAGNLPLNSHPAPTAALSLNSQKITSLADPTVPTDAATKNYVDNTAQGLNAKQACIIATTANITLSGLQAIDGYTTVAGDRVLVKNQTTQSANGIYLAASGAWTRAPDMDTWAEVPSAYVWVEEGSAQPDTGWVCTSDPGGTLGTTNIVWSQFSGSAVVGAGVGLTKSGNTISALPDGLTVDTGGASSSLRVMPSGITGAQIANGTIDLTTKVTAAALPVANGGTGQTAAKAARETGLGAGGYYSATGPASAGTTITITQATHGLRSGRGIHVQVTDNTSGSVEIPDVAIAANGDVTVTYAASVPINQKTVALVG